MLLSHTGPPLNVAATAKLTRLMSKRRLPKMVQIHVDGEWWEKLADFLVVSRCGFRQKIRENPVILT
jgi:hypothetical protein